jgi:hypothetical protein
MAASFGVTSTGGYGVLQEVTRGSSAEKAEYRDDDGKVLGEQAYSVTHTASANFVIDGATGADGDKAGTALTIGDLTALITSHEVTESNTDYKRGTVAIEKKDAATQAAYS